MVGKKFVWMDVYTYCPALFTSFLVEKDDVHFAPDDVEGIPLDMGAHSCVDFPGLLAKFPVQMLAIHSFTPGSEYCGIAEEGPDVRDSSLWLLCHGKLRDIYDFVGLTGRFYKDGQFTDEVDAFVGPDPDDVGLRSAFVDGFIVLSSLLSERLEDMFGLEPDDREVSFLVPVVPVAKSLLRDEYGCQPWLTPALLNNLVATRFDIDPDKLHAEVDEIHASESSLCDFIM